jgi:hypothetical protein
MLSIIKIMDGIYFIKENTPIHPLSTSNGFLLIPSEIEGGKSTNSKESILLDVNIEEMGWVNLKNFCYDSDLPLPNKLIMSHCHLDHSCHMHQFVDSFNGKVYAPEPEIQVLLEHDGFFKVFYINEMEDTPGLLDSYRHLKYDILGFNIISENYVKTYHLGQEFNFESVKIRTIPLTSHSVGHCGFIISFPQNNLKIFHTSCLGLDQTKIDANNMPRDGFGPWYGFKSSDLKSYLEDIKKAEDLSQDCSIITSSHGVINFQGNVEINHVYGKTNFIRIIDHNDNQETIFDYMRRKITNREKKILEAVESMGYAKKDIPRILNSEDIIQKIVNMDIVYSKYRIPSKLLVAYKFWERYIIINHLKYASLK